MPLGISTGKLILVGAAGAGILLLALTTGTAVSRINELSDNLTVETSGRIHKIEFSGITLAVDVIIKNPSRTAISFRHPFVKLRSSGKDLLSSLLKKEVYNIASYEEKKFTLYFKTSLVSLGTMLPALLKEYTAKGTLSLEVYAKTKLTAIGGITLSSPLPYPKTEMITFGKPNA
jgi:hypothetical protein